MIELVGGPYHRETGEWEVFDDVIFFRQSAGPVFYKVVGNYAYFKGFAYEPVSR